MTPTFWQGKHILVTGHTGFKGSWLSLWLCNLGAQVHGYSLEPPTHPNFFTEACISAGMTSSIIADICNREAIAQAMNSIKPEIVFHLAAQSLVRHSYTDPIETYKTNVMGTAHLLESIRMTSSVRAVVIVTSDKCYENHEWLWGYRENEPLGGLDPYSSSKSCAELVTSAYRHSFFEKTDVALASARAGNVIGGGDWAVDRLIPDFFRAFDRGETLKIRSPQAIRPWQHVLEPVSGYLRLAKQLYLKGKQYADAWNFGPSDMDTKSVRWIVERLASSIPGFTWELDNKINPHEAHALKLDSTKAKIRLNWQPRWHLDKALVKTLDWHIAWRRGEDMRSFSLSQIDDYSKTETNGS